MNCRLISWINKIKMKLEESKPQLITDKEQFRLIKKIDGFCGIYDGQPHYVIIESVNNGKILFSEDNCIWKSAVPFLLNSGFKTVYVKAYRNKRIEQCDINLEINKRNIILKSGSSKKEYDGRKLTNGKIEILGDGFVEKEGISAHTISSNIVAGQVLNEIKFNYLDGTNPNNYSIMVDPGKLIISDKYPKFEIQITGDSIETLYDETEKELPEFSNLDFILNDCRFHIQGISNKVKAIEEGVYQADKDKTLHVHDDYSNDVTSQFKVEVRYGTLTILHNTEYDVPNNVDRQEYEIDEYDITIQGILDEMSGKAAKEREAINYSRKELESLYVDHIHLLRGQGTIDPNYEFMLNAIQENNEFSKLRNRIVQDFREVDLLCQIEISDLEFNQLKEYFQLKYFNNEENGKHILVDILFSVFLVQVGIRYYENNFWPQVAAILGVTEIDQTSRPWVGGTVTKTLLAFGKPVFDENEYVTNILMHSFVTDSFSKRFFDYIFQYYSLDMERNLSGMQDIDISYLCNSIINPFAKRKQLLSKYTAMSIRGAFEYCKQVISDALHMIDCSFWDEEYDEHVLTGRLAIQFEKWKYQSDFYQTEKRRDTNKKRNRLFRAPHLMCEIETGIFTIVLPPQLIRGADVNEIPDVKWYVVAKEKKEFSCKLIEGYSGYKTDTIMYYPEPEDIFEKHVFLLFVNKEMVRSFTWDKRKINFFTQNGLWVNGDRLEVGLTYAFGRDDSEIVSDSLMYVSRKNSLKFYELNIRKDDLVCVPGENNYYVGSIPKPGLTPKGLLEGVIALHVRDEREICNVYNEAPIIIIDVTQEQYHGLAIIINKQVHKLSEINYTDVRFAKTSEKKYYFIDTQKISGIKYGWNNVVVDYPGSSKHYVCEFYYHPSLHYNFVNAPYVFADNGILLIQEHANKVLSDEEGGEKWKTIHEQQFSMTELQDGHICYEMDDSCILDFAVPMLRYSWDNVQWNYCKIEEAWHTDLQDVLYLEFPASCISLCVAGRNENISLISYRKQQSGKFVCELTKLKSYFNSEKIEETINFISGEINIPLMKILQRSFLFCVKSTCDCKKNIIQVYFDLIGKNNYYAELYCEGERITEKVELTNQTVEFNSQVETANYSVKLYESEVDFGFDDEYSFVGEKEFSLINPKELIGGCMKVVSIRNDGVFFRSHENYTYYLFIDKRISTSSYKGVLSGVFHKDYVMYASKVIVTIPDFNEFSNVKVTRLSYSEKPERFAFDLRSEAITEDRRNANDKNHRTLSEKTIWEVEYISSNIKRRKESIEFIEKSEIARRKAHSIWKND